MIWNETDRNTWLYAPSPGVQHVFAGECISTMGKIGSASYLRRSRGTPFPPMRVYGRYALVLIIDGGGTYRDTNGIRQKVARGDVIWVHPELAHSYGPIGSEHWTELHINFQGPLFDLCRSTRVLRIENPVDHVDNVDEWLDRLETYLDSLVNLDSRRSIAAVLEFGQIIVALSASGSEAMTVVPRSPWVREAISRMEASLREPLNLRQMARDSGLTYDSFRKGFQAEIGISPTAYHLDVRLRAARELLKITRLTSKEISEALGFSDEYHFSRRFFEKVGLRPSVYRRSQREHP